MLQIIAEMATIVSRENIKDQFYPQTNWLPASYGKDGSIWAIDLSTLLKNKINYKKRFWIKIIYLKKEASQEGIRLYRQYKIVMEDIVYSSEYLCEFDCKNRLFLNEFAVYHYDRAGNCLQTKDYSKNGKGCFEKIPPDSGLITAACHLDKETIEQIAEQFAKEVNKILLI